MFGNNKPFNLFSMIEKYTSNIPFLISIKRALTYLIPVVLLGNFTIVIVNLPIPEYQSFMENSFGEHWKNVFMLVQHATLDIISVLMTLLISYLYAKEYSKKADTEINPLLTAIVSLCSFVSISWIQYKGFNLPNFGTIGAFTAILSAALSTKLFIILNSIKKLKIRVQSDGADPSFMYTMTSLVPAILTIITFCIFNIALLNIFHITDIQMSISNSINFVIRSVGSQFWQGILSVFLVQILWFFGIHGNNIVQPLIQDIFAPVKLRGIFSKEFFDIFVLVGGSGATLCLLIALLFIGKHKNRKRLAKISLIPVVFNINELLIYGVPIVLNPVFFIPFLFVPLLFTLDSYFAIVLGLVPRPIYNIDWTTPIVLSGYLSTRSINGCLLQIVNLVIGTLCYIPFVKMSDKISTVNQQVNIDKVYTAFKEFEEKGMISSLLSRQDDVGDISRFLSADLAHALSKDNLSLYYQPQVDFYGNVFGVEALLRWKHENSFYVYPPLIIALSEESQLIEKLGYWIFDTACKDLKRLNSLGYENLIMAINVSAIQLEDVNFSKKVLGLIKKYQLSPSMIKIEITERIALNGSKRVINQLRLLKESGIKLAMDDFGMGHSSLMYLKEYDFDTVKLDGSLIREMLDNINCQKIISSIVSLGKDMNYSVIAEFVEGEAQRQLLHKLGCDIYQGYLYSKAVSFEDLSEYLVPFRVE